MLRAGQRRNGPSLKPSPLYRRRSTNIAQDSTVSSKAVMPKSTSSSNDVPLHAGYQWGASTWRICSATRAHLHKLCTLCSAFTDFGYTVVRRKTLPPYRKPTFLAFNVTRSVHKQSKNVFTTLFTNSTVPFRQRSDARAESNLPLHYIQSSDNSVQWSQVCHS